MPTSFPGQINTYAGIDAGCISISVCTAAFMGSNSLSYTSVEAYLDDVMAEFATALGVLQGSGAEVVVLGPASWSDFPGTTLSAGLAPNPIVSEAVARLVDEQRALALSLGLPFVDLQALLEDFASLGVGGLSLLPGAPPTGTRDPRHWFLPDGIHPDTIASGLVANAMIAALNGAYGASLTPFTDAEILGFAGLVPDAGWDGVSVDVSPYVTLPEPAAGCLLLVVAGWAGARARRQECGRA